MNVHITLSDSFAILPLSRFESFPHSCVMAMAESYTNVDKLEIDMSALSLSDLGIWLKACQSNKWSVIAKPLRESLERYGLINEGLFYYFKYLEEKLNTKEKKLIEFMSKGGFFLCGNLEKFEILKKNVFRAKEYVPCRISVSLSRENKLIDHVMLWEKLLMGITDDVTKGTVDVNRVKYDAFFCETDLEDDIYEEMRQVYKGDINYSRVGKDSKVDICIISDPNNEEKSLLPRLFSNDPSLVMSAVGHMNSVMYGYVAGATAECPLFYKSYEEMKLPREELTLNCSPVEICKVIKKHENDITKRVIKDYKESYIENLEWGSGDVEVIKYCVCYGFVKL